MAYTIGEIRQKLNEAASETLPEIIKLFEADERAGIQKLVEGARKKITALEKERARTEALKKYEKLYDGYTYICGIDEVGRGPLAGPVVAGAVILPKDCDILYINDSKKLSEKKREELYDIIMAEGLLDVAAKAKEVWSSRMYPYFLKASLQAATLSFSVTTEGNTKPFNSWESV